MTGGGVHVSHLTDPFPKQLFIYTLWRISDVVESGSVADTHYKPLRVLVQLSNQFRGISISFVEVENINWWVLDSLLFFICHCCQFDHISCRMKMKITKYHTWQFLSAPAYSHSTITCGDRWFNTCGWLWLSLLFIWRLETQKHTKCFSTIIYSGVSNSL